jgi:hypothetical protein
VARARTTSTSFMTGTGLKKCRPIERSGRVPAEMAAIGSELVLLAKTVAAGQRSCSAANSSRFSLSSSGTASMISSQSRSSLSSVVMCRRPSAWSRSAASSFPFSTARATTSAIPLPMSPQPSTPTCRMSGMATSASGTRWARPRHAPAAGGAGPPGRRAGIWGAPEGRSTGREASQEAVAQAA